MDKAVNDEESCVTEEGEESGKSDINLENDLDLFFFEDGECPKESSTRSIRKKKINLGTNDFKNNGLDPINVIFWFLFFSLFIIYQMF